MFDNVKLKRCLIILGFLLLIIGIVSACLSVNGVSVATERYGGDAYTGIQNASAKTANNVKVLISYITLIIGLFEIVLGLGSFLLSAAVKPPKTASENGSGTPVSGNYHTGSIESNNSEKQS